MSFFDHSRTVQRPPTRRWPAIGAAVGAVLCLALGAGGCRRDSGPAPSGAEAPVAVTPGPLVTLTATVEPAAAAPGGRVTVLWRLRPAKGWHLYGPGRNDSGFAPRQKLDLPEGWRAGTLQWPAPARHVSAGDILDHVYEGELVLLQELTAPAAASGGDRSRLRAHWEWLACRDSCVPGRDSLQIDMAIASGATAAPASPELAAARSRLPAPLPAGLVQLEWDGPALRIEPLPAAGAAGLIFMPDADCGELADLLREGVGPRLALRLLPADGLLGPLKGVLLVQGTGGGSRAFALDVPAVPWIGTSPGSPSTGG